MDAKKNSIPLILLASPLIFSLELIFLNWVFSGGRVADPLTFTANRSLFTLVLMLVLFGKDALDSFPKSGSKQKGVLISLAKWALVLGVARFFADMIYFVAQSRTNPVSFSLLSQLSVFATAILAYFFLKERLFPREIFGGLVMVGGAILVVASKGAISIGGGDFVTLLFVLAISASNILSKRAMAGGLGRNAVLLGGFVVATIGFYALEPVFFGKNPLSDFSSQAPYTLAGGLFSAVNIGLVFYCIEKFGASRMQIAGIATVFFAPFFSFFLLGKLPTGWDFAGGAVIAVGAVAFLGLLPKLQGSRKFFNRS